MPQTIELAPITFSSVEMALLGSLLGGDVLPGMPEPFRGWFATEIEGAFNQVKDGLIRKGIIEPRTDGTVIINMKAALPVCACLYSDRIFILNYTPAGRRQKTRYFFRDGGLAVELTAQRSKEALYDLIPYTGAADVFERIRKGMHLQAQRAPECPAGLVPEKTLAEARDLASEEGGARAAHLLMNAGLHEQTAGALARTLNRPVGNGAVAAMTRTNQEWAVEGVAVLEGQNGLWMLRPAGGGLIEITPSPAAALRKELARLVLPPGCSPTLDQ